MKLAAMSERLPTDPDPDPPAWYPFANGATIGTSGSESGRILIDEEHPAGARITLEQGGPTAPFAITCGIYGGFLHTAFAGTESEATAKYHAMKARLGELLLRGPADDLYEDLRAFAERF
jgi:hypothetical protein